MPSGQVNQEETTRIDPMSKEQRSAQMAKVRSIGNKSTEIQVEDVLTQFGIQGWEKHPRSVLGTPDFFFADYKLVIFVDGCFWHGCPLCKRRTPKSEIWRKKLENNVKRDNRIHRQLRRDGYHVMRIWEHDFKKENWLKRLQLMIRRIEKTSK